MVEPQVYIGTTRLDLYPDETITLNQTVKNFRDVSKVFNEFTQSFTVPASSTNNQALSHWWNADISNNVNPAVKQSGRIDLNGIPFKTGVFALDKVNVKNGRPESYTITFYGNLTGLQDIFGNDTLNELELSAFKVDYTDYGDYIDGTLSGSVTIPLISPVEPWFYADPATVTDTSFGIKYAAGANQEGGIKYIDVKPALRLSDIINAIESKYGVTFTSNFIAAADFDKLYMWAHGSEGRTSAYERNYTRLNYNATSGTAVAGQVEYDTGNDWLFVKKFTGTGAATVDYNVQITIDPTTLGSFSANDITYDVVCYDAGNSNVKFTQSCVGDCNFTISTTTTLGGGNDENVYFGVRSNFPVDFTWILNASGTATGGSFDVTWQDTSSNTQIEPDKFYFSNGSYTDSMTGETVSVEGQLPKQKVTEFVAGLSKMFNFIIEPTSSTTFKIDPYDDWYASGVNYDLNKWVDAEEYTVNKVGLFGEIDFSYEPTSTILGKAFREANDGVGYGDLETKIVDVNGDPLSSETFEVKLPFTNILFSNLVDQSTGVETDIVVGKSTDKDNKPVTEKPIIFYRTGTLSISSKPIGVRDRLYDNLTQFNDYCLCFQFNTQNDSFTRSLNWGSEVNPYTGNTGGATDPSLYYTFWSDYITDLYDLQARRYEFEGVLPISLLIQLRMNDNLTIGTRTYKINSLRTDLRTGRSRMELLNVID